MDMKDPDKILVMYEIKVLGRRAKPEKIQETIETITQKVKENPFIDFLNVPEITEENFEGKPFYKSVDVVQFGRRLQEATGKPVIVNKVIGHLDGKKGFVNFVKQARDVNGIGNFVFVGVASPCIKYPGPFVSVANKLIANMDINVGNICIPNRPEEVDRIMQKTEAGCSFFTTQILMESDSMKRVLLEYDRACKERKIKPARIFFCFATVEDDYDLDFFKWLGVEISKETEKDLKKAKDKTGFCSERIKKIYEGILRFKTEHDISVPLGLNISQVSARNLDSSLKLAKELVEIGV